MICTRWLALSTRQSSNSLSTCDWVSSLGTTERKTIFALRSNTTISVISFRFNGLVSDRRVSNSRPLAWEASALPTELLSQVARGFGHVPESEITFYEKNATQITRCARELIKTLYSATIGIVDDWAVKPRHPYHMSHHGGCGI